MAISNSIGDSQKGFVLVFVLWILAAITILASFFAVWVHSVLDKVQQEQKGILARIEEYGTKSTVLYLLSTNSLNVGGLAIQTDSKGLEESVKQKSSDPFSQESTYAGDEMRLDDTVYAGLGRACFSIQDEGGLLGFQNLSSIRLDNLLGILGVPTTRRGPLVDKFLDYQDSDDLFRLNGAETDDYEKLGLPGPANYSLLTTREAVNILGWENEKKIWVEDQFPRLTTIATGGIPNFNTAPLSVLKAIPGTDEEMVSKIVMERNARPFVNLYDMETRIGKKLFIDPMDTGFFPSSNLRITLWHEDTNRYREIHLKLTTMPESRLPWEIDHEIKAPIIEKLKSTPKEIFEIFVFTTPNSPV